MSVLTKRLPKWASPKKPVDMFGDYRKAYGVKTSFGMLGPVASGKSTIAAGIVHTCEVLSALVPGFFARVLPTSTHILSDANNLLLGRFPEKTNPLTPKRPEAGLLICERGWREKKVMVPICDVAGEITDYIQMKAAGHTTSETIRQRTQGINYEVVQAVRNSEGFIIALAAPDALMFRDAPSTLDPDVYTYTVLNDIFEYRRINRKPDPHIICILTKWDMVQREARDIQMDVYDGQLGMARFLANGFPATNMLLKPLVDKGLVKFFRSWFKIKQREDGAPEKWPDDSPRIELLEDPDAFVRFRPKFAEHDYMNIVHHIGSFGK